MQPRRLFTELLPIAGRRQRDVAHVELEIEIAILDPVRMIGFTRHFDELAPETLREVQPLFDIAEDVPEPNPSARRGRLIVQRQRCDVHMSIRRLGIDEGSVLGTELLHDIDPPRTADRNTNQLGAATLRMPAGQAQSAWIQKSPAYPGKEKSHGRNEPRIHAARRRTGTAPQRRRCDERRIGYRPAIVHRCAGRGR